MFLSWRLEEWTIRKWSCSGSGRVQEVLAVVPDPLRDVDMILNGDGLRL